MTPVDEFEKWRAGSIHHGTVNPVALSMLRHAFAAGWEARDILDRPRDPPTWWKWWLDGRWVMPFIAGYSGGYWLSRLIHLLTH